MPRPLSYVDVFGTTPFGGNPVAVVLEASGLMTEQMQRVAHWMNLSETTFVLPPQDDRADYRVRIFTPAAELPFAGHPTLGSCHAWLVHTAAGDRDAFVQECAAGLVEVRRTDAGLAFAAPPLVRSGPVEESLVASLSDALGIDGGDVVDAQWVDNGPGWVALLLPSADAVLAVRPPTLDAFVGVVGPYPAGGPAAFEVRAFFPKDGSGAEDPVTGSLNASLAQWLVASGRAHAPYVVSQGTALGRRGRLHVTQEADGALWVGGATVTCANGRIDL